MLQLDPVITLWLGSCTLHSFLWQQRRRLQKAEREGWLCRLRFTTRQVLICVEYWSNSIFRCFFSSLLCFLTNFATVLCSVAGDVYHNCLCAPARSFEIPGQPVHHGNHCIWKQDCTVSLRAPADQVDRCLFRLKTSFFLDTEMLKIV